MRVFTDPNTLIPEVHLVVQRQSRHGTNAGGGYSAGAISPSPAGARTSLRLLGTFIYLRDRDTGRYCHRVSTTLRKADHCERCSLQARAEYRRRDQAIEATRDQRFTGRRRRDRRVTLTNQSSRTVISR